MGCGKCGETYEFGETHICEEKQKPTIESLQRTNTLLMSLLQNHSERIKALEFKILGGKDNA